MSRGVETSVEKVVESLKRQQMQLSRICQGINQQKAKGSSIDPLAVEKLSRI